MGGIPWAKRDDYGATVAGRLDISRDVLRSLADASHRHERREPCVQACRLPNSGPSHICLILQAFAPLDALLFIGSGNGGWYRGHPSTAECCVFCILTCACSTVLAIDCLFACFSAFSPISPVFLATTCGRRLQEGADVDRRAEVDAGALIPDGTRVELSGLTAAPALNGTFGAVVLLQRRGSTSVFSWVGELSGGRADAPGGAQYNFRLLRKPTPAERWSVAEYPARAAKRCMPPAADDRHTALSGGGPHSVWRAPPIVTMALLQQMALPEPMRASVVDVSSARVWHMGQSWSSPGHRFCRSNICQGWPILDPNRRRRVQVWASRFRASVPGIGEFVGSLGRTWPDLEQSRPQLAWNRRNSECLLIEHGANWTLESEQHWPNLTERVPKSARDGSGW